MDRMQFDFTVVGLRAHDDKGRCIEVKLRHEDDLMLLIVPSDVEVSLGRRYRFSLAPLAASEKS